MRIGIVSDGKFDNRAFEVIRDSTRWNESWPPSSRIPISELRTWEASACCQMVDTK